MLNISAKPRKILGRKVKNLRKEGLLPAVLYGPGIENKPLEVQLADFEKVFKEAGENTLVTLEVAADKKYQVLTHNIRKDPLTETPLHVDFYQPALDKKIEGEIPIILEGEAPAVKNLGGTLIKNIAEIKVMALPQDLPKEFRINIDSLKSFEDHILVKDLNIPQGVEVLRREADEILVQVVPPEKVEEELAKPIEEKVEEVEKVEKEKKEEEETTEEPPKEKAKKPQ